MVQTCVSSRPLTVAGKSGRRFTCQTKDGMAEMNIKKIAKIANVDHSTVSRALRDSPVVKQATKERILQIAKDYHYVPNEIARSLKTKKTKIIGLIVSDIKNPFFTEIISATESYLARNNYNIILCNTNYSVQKEQQFLNILYSRRASTASYSPPPRWTTSTRSSSRDASSRTSCWTSSTRTSPPTASTSTRSSARYSAVTYLLEKGHKKIAFLAGPEDHVVLRAGNRRVPQGAQEIRCPAGEDLIFRIPQDYDVAYAETLKLLKRKKITAIFSLTDFMCIGIYRALQEMGLRIPKDIAVIGYDDLASPGS